MIPEAAVEAAAKMLAETCDPLGDWDKAEESYRWIYRRRVMPCIQAAAPHMLAEVWDQAIEAHKAWTWDDENIDPLANPYRPTP